MVNKAILKNSICGTAMLVGVIGLSYIHAFGYAHDYVGYWAYFIQLMVYCFASGYITTAVVHLILDKVSPWFRYWVQQKTMKRILIIIFAFEFAMVFAFGLDIGFRTIVVWVFVPVYQILSKLRSIPTSEALGEKMRYLPNEDEI